ncbi:MAG: three-Cys-motif partner protein TcmP [Minisyncoccales bacterium]
MIRKIKPHTIDKLTLVDKCTNAYLVATKRLTSKYYIDAFAGTGKCFLCSRVNCLINNTEECLNCGRGKIIDGSCLRVLKIKNKFDKYFFIDLKKSNVNLLKECVNDDKEVNSSLKEKIEYIKGDSNKVLKIICEKLKDEKYLGCLAFLDPEGPELYWETIKYLSEIPKIDLLILYAYEMSLVRLTREYKEKLDKFYGGEEWREVYRKGSSTQKRTNNLLNFYIDNLKKLGFMVAEKRITRKMRGGHPLYHLIGASKNKAGFNIFQGVLNNKELDGQRKLF